MAVLRLPARLDITNEEFPHELRRAIAEPDLELDGSDVQRVDAAGLQLLAAAARRVGALRWKDSSLIVREGARVLGLTTVLGLGLAQEDDH